MSAYELATFTSQTDASERFDYKVTLSFARGSTVGELKPKVEPGIRANNPFETESSKTSESENKISAAAPHATRPAETAATNVVPGTVLECSSDEVVCEIVTPTRTFQISLRPDIFPFTPQFGMPFSLEMITVAGFQQPRISQRSVVRTADSISSRADELLRAF